VHVFHNWTHSTCMGP